MSIYTFTARAKQLIATSHVMRFLPSLISGVSRSLATGIASPTRIK